MGGTVKIETTRVNPGFLVFGVAECSVSIPPVWPQVSDFLHTHGRCWRPSLSKLRQTTGRACFRSLTAALTRFTRRVASQRTLASIQRTLVCCIIGIKPCSTHAYVSRGLLPCRP